MFKLTFIDDIGAAVAHLQCSTDIIYAPYRKPIAATGDAFRGPDLVRL